MNDYGFKLGDRVKFASTANHCVYEGEIKDFFLTDQVVVSCEQLPFMVVVPSEDCRPVLPSYTCTHRWCEIQRRGDAISFECSRCGAKLECRSVDPKPPAEPFAPAECGAFDHQWPDRPGRDDERCTVCGKARAKWFAELYCGVNLSS